MRPAHPSHLYGWTDGRMDAGVSVRRIRDEWTDTRPGRGLDLRTVRGRSGEEGMYNMPSELVRCRGGGVIYFGC